MCAKQIEMRIPWPLLTCRNNKCGQFVTGEKFVVT